MTPGSAASVFNHLIQRDLSERLTGQAEDDPRRAELAAMLAAAQAIEPKLLRSGAGDDGVWIWSDLHFGHAEAPEAFGRPFRDAAEMDRRLFAAWAETVDAAGTVVCLGDVTARGLSGTTLHRVRAMPGRKILVIGNHDLRTHGETAVEGFDETHAALAAPGDPPLLLTHLPLLRVPAACVNVHGHTHNRPAEGVERRINMCVEHTGYRPVPLAAVRRLARRLADEETVAGSTTAEQLAAIR